MGGSSSCNDRKELFGCNYGMDRTDGDLVIGAATARVAWVRTLPTFENLTWTRQILCSEVLIHYNLDPTNFSTPVAPLDLVDRE